MNAIPKQGISVSLANVVLIVATGLLLVLLWQLRSLLVALMIAVVIAATLAPIIARAQRLQIPRWLAVIVVYLGLIALFTGAGLLIGPTVIKQIERLIRGLPTYLEIVRSLAENLAIRLGMTDPDTVNPISELFDTQALTGWVIRTSQQLLIRSYDVTRGILGGFFTLILSLLFSGYMLSGSETLIKGLVGSSVNVHPLYQLLAVLGGTQVLGIVGALIVPPWVAGAAVLLENLYLKPKQLAEKAQINAPLSTAEIASSMPVNH